ncbi:NAD(+) synthase [Botrimarina sp.]|uniref:NAD(+) synthase n=1 Tax=Botrimarina sp. TaxID=2795802 RepID=UPI0032EE0BB0
MPTIRLAAAAVNQTPVDWHGNLARVVRAVEAARAAGAGLVCLPELCLTGYGCEDLYYSRGLRRRALESLEELLPHTEGVAVAVGLPLEIDRALYNAEAILADGELLGFALKQHLANDGLHYEARWFNPWPAGVVAMVDAAGATVPAGDLVFDFASGAGGEAVRVGVEVCRDAWVPGRPALSLAERGVSLLLNPSASHFAFAKQTIRQSLAREGAAAVDGVFVYTNLLGNESGRSIYDGGAMIARSNAGAEPEIVAAQRRFSYADHTLLLADLGVRAARPPAAAAAAARSRFDLSLPQAEAPPLPESQRDQVATKYEEFSRAAPLGLLDYLRKSGARGFVLSLSGGADSAACAVLVWLMARFAIDELGPQGFADRLQRVDGLAGATDARAAVARLLTTVYQGTQNSSDATRTAAAAIAGAVGAEHHEWDVDPLVEGYTRLAGEALGRPLTWETDDTALQNIQSRARAPGVWMLANVKDALLLTTGNRSEASVGYATMDGDTAGGLAPLSGVDKAFLRDWLGWMEKEGPRGVGPMPALAAINAQQPTAELRPLADRQTDEADLMPYDVLDAIERSVIVRLEEPEQTLAGLEQAFPGHAPEQLAEWVDRFRRLWRASQWKRERMAPGFHLDTHSVDSRGFRRWPILSGSG